ncbi:MAG: hypothetical protein AB8C84_02805 [Oligoflexales bacterium]
MKSLCVILCFYTSWSFSLDLKDLPKDILSQMVPENLSSLQKTNKNMFFIVQEIFNSASYRKKYPRYWVLKKGLFYPGDAQDLLVKYCFDVEKYFCSSDSKSFEEISSDLFFDVDILLQSKVRTHHSYQKISYLLLLKALNEALQTLKFFIPNELHFAHGPCRGFFHLNSERTLFNDDRIEIEPNRVYTSRYLCVAKFCLLTHCLIEKDKGWIFIRAPSMSMSLKQHVCISDYSFFSVSFSNDFLFSESFLKNLRSIRNISSDQHNDFKKHINQLIFLMMLDHMAKPYFMEKHQELCLLLMRDLNDESIEVLLENIYFEQDGEDLSIRLHRLLFDKIMD